MILSDFKNFLFCEEKCENGFLNLSKYIAYYFNAFDCYKTINCEFVNDLKTAFDIYISSISILLSITYS